MTNVSGEASTPRKVDDSDYRLVGDWGIIYTRDPAQNPPVQSAAEGLSDTRPTWV